MRIDERIAGDAQPSFSFEFFPPKTEDGARNLEEAMAALSTMDPTFVSVTYGAGGTPAEKVKTIDIVSRMKADFVREAMFNILGDRVDGRLVIDLFAGTGALGLEALSRGAARAIFVEKKGDNVALIHRNMATLRFEDRASVLAVDAYRWARTFEPIDDEPMAPALGWAGLP